MVKSAVIRSPPLPNGRDIWIANGLDLLLGDLASLETGTTTPRPSTAAVAPSAYSTESCGPALLAGCVVSIVVMTTITGLRLWLRSTRSRLSWGIDDWMIIPGVILATLYPVICIVAIAYGGYGKHTLSMTYFELYVYAWCINLNRIVFYAAVGVVKMSITFFNMRLVGLSSQKWININRAFIALLIGYTIGAILALIFQCDPVYGSFDLIAIGHRNKAPKCLSINVLTGTLSAFHVSFDLCLLSVPLILLWKVNMDRKAKIRIMLLFSAGSISVLGSVMRQVSQSQAIKKNGRWPADTTWKQMRVLAWALVDLTFGVSAASLPTLNALFKGHGSKIHNTTDEYGSSADGTRPPFPSAVDNSSAIRRTSINISNQLTTLMREYGLEMNLTITREPSPEADNSHRCHDIEHGFAHDELEPPTEKEARDLSPEPR